MFASFYSFIYSLLTQSDLQALMCSHEGQVAAKLTIPEIRCHFCTAIKKIYNLHKFLITLDCLYVLQIMCYSRFRILVSLLKVFSKFFFYVKYRFCLLNKARIYYFVRNSFSDNIALFCFFESESIDFESLKILVSPFDFLLSIESLKNNLFAQ